MQLHEAARVIEVQGDEEANRLLAEGWKLLAVTSGIHVRDSARSAVCYVLGKPAEKKEPPKMPTAADIARANEGL